MASESDNPWLGRRVIAYAHQGGAWEAPSSTLFAIRRALAAGATAIELDVHATLDGALVVCHDETVDRTTDGHGVIAAMTLEELKALDNAHWFIPGADVTPGRDPGDYPYRGRAPQDPDFAVPTLREVLETFPGVVLNLDIKQTAPAVRAYEKPLADLLVEFDRQEDVIVASFDDGATAAFAELGTGIATSAGTEATAAFWQAVQAGKEPPVPPGVVALQVPERYGETRVVDEHFVAAAHRAGVAVHVWTVDDEPQMERLLDVGVDGIITDLPTTLTAVLRRRSAEWEAGR